MHFNQDRGESGSKTASQQAQTVGANSNGMTPSESDRLLPGKDPKMSSRHDHEGILGFPSLFVSDRSQGV